jgi:signal transduction histidine kinase
MVTALREVEDRVKALDLGCDDFISKPFEKVEMLARVKSLLRISYYRSQLDEKEKFETLLNQIEDVLVVLNGDLQPVKYNRPARELLQLDPQAPGGILASLSEHFKVAYRGDLSSDLKSEPRVFDVTREELASVKELILEMKSSIFREPSGELSNVILLGRDVTAVREEERVKQNFFDLVSHKLMTPITIIASQGELFNLGTYGQLSDNQKQAVEVIYKQVLSLKRLVIKLFSFITLDQKNLEALKVEIDLAGQFPGVIDPLVKSSGRTVETAIDCPPDLKLSMNKNYFDAMIGNLVENAAKFCDKEPVKLTISANRGFGGLQIKVSDNGPGIPPEEQGKIFQGFYQVEKSFTGQVEGAGLGLALVKKIVELSGGKIGVESVLGQGTTVVIDLP